MFISLIISGCLASLIKTILQSLAAQTAADSFLGFQLRVARNLSLSLNVSSTAPIDNEAVIDRAIDAALLNPGVSESVREGLPASASISDSSIRLSIARMCANVLSKQMLTMSKVSPGLLSQAKLAQSLSRTLVLGVPAVSDKATLEHSLEASLNAEQARANGFEATVQAA